MPSVTKYDVLEEESDENSADVRSELVRKNTRLQSRSQRLSSYLLWYSAISTTLILILSVVLLSGSTPKNCTTIDHLNSTMAQNCLDRPYRGIFGRNRQYMSLDHRYDILWDDIEDNRRDILFADPDEQGKEFPAVIAMFHQLHCLQSFRQAIQLGHEGTDPGFNWRDETMHWPHCLGYMRAAILCWADDTLEKWSFLDDGTPGDIAEGYFDDRQCGDNRKLIKAMRDAGKVVRTRPFP